MGYYNIDNLYKAQEILAFKKCYALEKIHGTSANITWHNGQLQFSPGGESYERFITLFDVESLKKKFSEKFLVSDTVVVYGEAYGGKQQGMSKTYGKELKFVAFDIKVGNSWLAVPQAFDCATNLGFEFVDFVEIETTLEALNNERDKPSVQAKRNGITEDKPREGIVLRPPFEIILNNGRRCIAKYKREEFKERADKTPEIDSVKREIMENAEKIAENWVTAIRLEHIIDQLISSRDDKSVKIQDTGKIINLMIEDVIREAKDEIIDNQSVRKAIGTKAAKIFKQSLQIE